MQGGLREWVLRLRVEASGIYFARLVRRAMVENEVGVDCCLKFVFVVGVVWFQVWSGCMSSALVR